VDIVADTMTANCARWKDVNFSTIYYEAGQKVLVSSDSPVKRIEDLGGKKVCAAAGSTSFDNIGKVKTKPIAVAKPAFGDCLVAFQQNEVDAISTDDTILFGFMAQDPQLRLLEGRYSDEQYGIAINDANDDLVRFVNGVLEAIRADGRWAQFLAETEAKLGVQLDPPSNTPPDPTYLAGS
jgi:polar amino acid transport system substrate-binding protein